MMVVQLSQYRTIVTYQLLVEVVFQNIEAK